MSKEVEYVLIASIIFCFGILLGVFAYYIFGNVYYGMYSRRKKVTNTFNKLIEYIPDLINCLVYLDKQKVFSSITKVDINNLIESLKNVDKKIYNEHSAKTFNQLRIIFTISDFAKLDLKSEKSIDIKNAYIFIKKFIFTYTRLIQLIQNYNGFIGLPINRILRKQFKYYPIYEYNEDKMQLEEIKYLEKLGRENNEEK